MLLRRIGIIDDTCLFYESVSVIFVDICHFWEMVTDYGAPHLVSFLDAIYQAFDEMADKFAIQKMETVGKTYLVLILFFLKII